MITLNFPDFTIYFSYTICILPNGNIGTITQDLWREKKTFSLVSWLSRIKYTHSKSTTLTYKIDKRHIPNPNVFWNWDVKVVDLGCVRSNSNSNKNVVFNLVHPRLHIRHYGGENPEHLTATVSYTNTRRLTAWQKQYRFNNFHL